MGALTAKRLTSGGLTARDIFEAEAGELNDLCRECIPNGSAATRAFTCLMRAKGLDPAQFEQMLRRSGIGFVSIEEDWYPEKLRYIPDPPYGLFYIGKLPLSHRPCVALIGARECSRYGLQQAERFGAVLASAGIQIVSGLARGIDGAAGRAAAACGLSYAVMGCGPDICYPQENLEIYDMIARSGGILSEYVPGTEPRPGMFPLRNRIISGLADAVVVLEARRKSGSLITADQALEQGRDVYALPGRVSDGLSDGCNQLIRQGAEIICSPEDLIERFFGLRGTDSSGSGPLQSGRTPAAQQTSMLPPPERAAMEYLDTVENADLDEISAEMANRLGRAVGLREVSGVLLQLELMNLVRVEGGRYMLSR